MWLYWFRRDYILIFYIFISPKLPMIKSIVKSLLYFLHNYESWIDINILTGWQSAASIHALISEWIQSVDRSCMVLRRKASKSRKTSWARSRYLAGWWGMMVDRSRLRHLQVTTKHLVKKKYVVSLVKLIIRIEYKFQESIINI